MIYLGLAPQVEVCSMGFNGGWRPDFQLAFGKHLVLFTLGFIHVMVRRG